MRTLILLLIYVLNIYAVEPLHVESNDRYFGGLSELKAEVPISVMLTPSTIITEEVFSAKDTQEVEVAVMKQKKEQVKSGTQVKDFAMESTGHLYGGVSETTLSF
jgi:hypothetical protein